MQKTQSARDTKGKKLGVTPAAAKANAATDTAEERDAIRADESAKASRRNAGSLRAGLA
jgi:hypothetical protein